MRVIIHLAYYAFLESWRNYFPWISGVVLALAYYFSVFIASISLTESMENQRIFLAASLNVFILLLSTFYLVAGIHREAQDKAQEFILANPIRRYQYFFSKLLMSSILAGCLIIPSSMLMWWVSSFEMAVYWALGLYFEVQLVLLVAVIFALNFSHIAMSLLATMSFWLLSRVMPFIQGLGDSLFVENASSWQKISHYFMDFIALVLPKMDVFLQSKWLLDGGELPAISSMLSEFLLYLILLISVGLYDFYRKVI